MSPVAALIALVGVATVSLSTVAPRRALAEPICRPGAVPTVLQGTATRWSVSPCGGGVESVKLVDPQFQVQAQKQPSSALPGWAQQKWAPGPLELVPTWDARWDPFQERVLLRDAGPLTVGIAPADDVTPVQRTFQDLAAMAQELPQWTVLAADAKSVSMVWPDPARVRSPVYIHKTFALDADQASGARSDVQVWWLGKQPARLVVEHVVSTYQDSADSGGGFLAMLAGPPDVKGAGLRVGEETVHFDASGLADAEPQERLHAATPKWLGTDSRYFLLATIPVAGFGEGSNAELRAVGNGVLEAVVRTGSLTLASAEGACLPSWLADRLDGTSCAADMRRLGLDPDEGAPHDPTALHAAATKAGGDAIAASERVQKRQVTRLTMRHFAGSKEIDGLRAMGAELDEAIDFGWFGAIARPLLFVLKMAHGMFGSWPLAILLLTLLVKAVLWPIMGKSQKSMRKMASLKPELDKIRADLAADAKRRGLDQPDPAELNRATFALYQKHGVNPLGGCLPMLLQMPVYIALYRTISSSVELYNQPLFGWITDLTQHDPFYVLPVVLGVLMVLQQKFTPMTTTDEAQRKMMMWFMPIMFSVMMMSLPSGLTLYILTNTVLSMVQTWWLQRQEA